MLARFLRKDDKAGNGSDVIAVSFVVIVYDMPQQAENTVRSLLPGYQLDVTGREYEIIVVENASANLMRAEFLDNLPDNVRYFLREQPESSPAQAINFGAGLARGEHICVMIDGARMLTPGVVRSILRSHRMLDNAVVAVPGYHLGGELQQEAVNSGYNLERERELLESIAWPEAGYRLFDIACFSGSSAPGLFMPNSESNCLSLHRLLWQALEGCDERFDLRGGGLINLDLYKRACEYPGVQHVIVLGEGTFHQFHGGVTTGGQSRELREAYIEQSKKQYRALRGAEFVSPVTQPVYLGEIPAQAQRFVHYSAARVLAARGEAPLDGGPA